MKLRARGQALSPPRLELGPPGPAGLQPSPVEEGEGAAMLLLGAAQWAWHEALPTAWGWGRCEQLPAASCLAGVPGPSGGGGIFIISPAPCQRSSCALNLLECAMSVRDENGTALYSCLSSVYMFKTTSWQRQLVPYTSARFLPGGSYRVQLPLPAIPSERKWSRLWQCMRHLQPRARCCSLARTVRSMPGIGAPTNKQRLGSKMCRPAYAAEASGSPSEDCTGKLLKCMPGHFGLLTNACVHCARALTAT